MGQHGGRVVAGATPYGRFEFHLTPAASGHAGDLVDATGRVVGTWSMDFKGPPPAAAGPPAVGFRPKATDARTKAVRLETCRTCPNIIQACGVKRCVDLEVHAGTVGAKCLDAAVPRW